MVECLSYKPKTMMNKLIPTRSLLTRKYTLVYLSSKPMEKETEVDDKSHKDKSDKLQDQNDSSKDYRDDKAIEEDECVHDSVFLRVNKYVT